MPLTDKGEKILANMKTQYGADRGERVFYASKNAGTIEGVDSRDDAEMKEGDEIKFRNHVIRCTGSPRGKVYTVFGPKRGAGNSYIGEAGTLDGAKQIAAGGGRSDDDDALRACADALAGIGRRMDSLLIRQRTGHGRSLHDDATYLNGERIDATSVGGLVSRLEAALHDPESFKRVMGDVESLSTEEIRELVREFKVGPAGKATSRKRLLEFIWHRHNHLMEFAKYVGKVGPAA
jgi:hypothetical protein